MGTGVMGRWGGGLGLAGDRPSQGQVKGPAWPLPVGHPSFYASLAPSICRQKGPVPTTRQVRPCLLLIKHFLVADTSPRTQDPVHPHKSPRRAGCCHKARAQSHSPASSPNPHCSW